jgi:hypothetical protein
MRTTLAAVTMCLFAAAAADAGPCLSTQPSCVEWVTLGGGPARSRVYRSFPLTVRNEQVVRALVVVHGQGRDADNYFRSALAAGFLAGALDDTIILAPRLASKDRSCGDALDRDEINWPCAGQSWRSGAKALGAAVTSYDLMDQILRMLARKDVFPRLRAIVVTGHSAGGQYVSRYAAANRVHESLGVPVTYVVSNPSSYAYPDGNRPAAEGGTFGAFGDARNCTTYNRWPYGLEARVGYSAQLTDDQVKQQMIARRTIYLLGDLDILPLAGFDGSCPAMAQGPTRLARGQSFVAYLKQQFGAREHSVTVVPLCGHNARCMYTSEAGLAVLFPKP